MAYEKVSPDIAYMQNLTVISAMLELAGPAMVEVIGSDELSNQINGVSQTQRDLQELLATRFEHQLNAPHKPDSND
jgi:hypothetical protein